MMLSFLEGVRKRPNMYIYPSTQDLGKVVVEKGGATKVVFDALVSICLFRDCYYLSTTYNPEWGSGTISARFEKSLPKNLLSQNPLDVFGPVAIGLQSVGVLAALSRESYLWAGRSFQYLERGVKKEKVGFDPEPLPRNELRVDFDLDRRVFPVFQIDNFLRKLRSELKGTQVCARIQTDCDIRPGDKDPSTYNIDDDEDE